ncbi:DEAD/DEAH box helicase [Arsenicicoccus sp. oral taxon 190]|uniref:DEAD/DEAH box helicase n=1 Tax=Arsenicicoccus sp. oral taxon 190 TaxID=1658671 RepID=UPI00067A1F0A|nr:DEAD/DEAH box helicase [Arsenicicoccus sp. oral taxon 190]AKT51941.1 RNA helicase [Arsenicicoccus sp. oral taxon 190]
MTIDAFARLGVPTSLTAELAKRGITEPTPIQAVTLPDSLAGRDVLGRGRTGSGKTYAFLLPVLARLGSSRTRRQARRPRALVLAPTRELATQIETAALPLAQATGMRTLTVFGGVGQGPQVSALERGVDLLIACPGRLQDLAQQGLVDLGSIEITVLDEADHMADLGFLPTVRKILDRTPERGQRMLFSATLDAGVDVLAKRYLHDPVTHHADSAQSPVSAMEHHVLHVTADDHLPVLVDLTAGPGRSVVFTRTKYRAKKLARQLNRSGVPAVELHGNLGQGARTRNLDAFHSGDVETLVATDIAARGIHVDDVTLVIHADPPVEHKAYLHRSGRTARAGAAGTVVTMMLDDQVKDVRDLARAAGIKPTTTRVGPDHALLRRLVPGERTYAAATDAAVSAPEAQQGSGRRGGRVGGSRSGGGSRQGGARQGGGNRSGQSQGRRQGSGSGAAQGGSGSRQGGQQRQQRQQASGQARQGASGGGSRGGARPARSGGAAAFSAGSSAGRRGR